MNRSILAAVVGFALALSAVQAQAAWKGSWGASPAPADPGAAGPPARASTPTFENQTIVQVVRLSAGGARLRLRLSNEYGQSPLAIGAASVSVLGPDGSAGPATAVTFDGKGEATIPPGAPLVSDAVALKTRGLTRLSVALYLPGRAPCTCHTTGAEVVRVSPPGNHIGEAFASVAAESAAYRAFLTGVEVDEASRGPVIAAFGDSITDGARSTPRANSRWPDRLAERLAGASVVNAGISGNRLLASGEDRAWAGEAALARFDRDVLSVSGLTHVVVLEGVNDIGRGGANPPSADALILAYSQLIDRAHAHGAKAIGGTILPYEGAAYFRPEGEAVRQAVNRWIRTSGAFDGVIDFDAAMRDPSAPGKLRADLQSGDWLHPNDAGYRVMGDAVDLKLFR